MNEFNDCHATIDSLRKTSDAARDDARHALITMRVSLNRLAHFLDAQARQIEQQRAVWKTDCNTFNLNEDLIVTEIASGRRETVYDALHECVGEGTEYDR